MKIQRQKEEENNQTNYLNALTRAASAMIAAGGPTNPAAWAMAAGSALTTPKGKEFKPIESAVSGYTTGVTGAAIPGASGGDLGQFAASMIKPENIAQTLPFIKSLTGGKPEDILQSVANNQAEEERSLKGQKKESFDRKMDLLRIPGLDEGSKSRLLQGLSPDVFGSEGASGVQSLKVLPDSKSAFATFSADIGSKLVQNKGDIWKQFQELQDPSIMTTITGLPKDVQDDAVKLYQKSMSDVESDISNKKMASYESTMPTLDKSGLGKLRNQITADKYLQPNDRSKLYSAISSRQRQIDQDASQAARTAKQDARYAETLSRITSAQNERKEEKQKATEEKTQKKEQSNIQKITSEKYGSTVNALLAGTRTKQYSAEQAAQVANSLIARINSNPNISGQNRDRMVRELLKINTKMAAMEYQLK
jgi:hypothetical protein